MFEIKNIFLTHTEKESKMSKLFKCAGVSTCDGTMKVRFASDLTRTKTLIKTGHSEIDLIELKEPMTKEDAVAYLLSINFDNGNTKVRQVLEDAAEKRGVKEVPTMAKIAAKVEAKAKTAKAPKVDTKELEDAPF
jgi:hypothetical protein